MYFTKARWRRGYLAVNLSVKRWAATCLNCTVITPETNVLMNPLIALSVCVLTWSTRKLQKQKQNKTKQNWHTQYLIMCLCLCSSLLMFSHPRSTFTVTSVAHQDANYKLTHVDISLYFQIRYPRGDSPGSITSSGVYSLKWSFDLIRGQIDWT